jgi:hypothetical protein
MAYITITGMEVTNGGLSADSLASFVVPGSDHIRIVNNYIHDTNTNAVRNIGGPTDAKTTYLYIGGNVFTAIGPANSGPPGYTGGRAAVIDCYCDNSLFESNDISHGGDYTRTFGHSDVIRDNVYHDSYVNESIGYNGNLGSGDHIDGWQSWCAGTIPAPEAADYVLIEGNYEHDSPDVNEHFALINASDPCGTTTVIVRENITYNVGSMFYLADTVGQTAADHHKIYNNTLVDFLSPADHNAVNLSGVSAGSVINNIFYDAALDKVPYSEYLLKSGDVQSGGDYNLGFYTSGSKTWAAPINSEVHHVLNRDPLFVSGNPDFVLQSHSPGLNAGGPLTTVASGDSGSGNALIVMDAHFFQDGWAGVNADCIAVGTVTNHVCISSINYQTNTITLASSITRSAGYPVWLYSDSTMGRVLFGGAPNIGTPRTLPAPPTNLVTIPH